MTLKRKIVVTGAAGYVAGNFLRQLVREPWVGEVVGLDLQAPRRPVEGVRYETCDMRSPRWRVLLERSGADALVHTAFVVNPMHDEALMQQINVEGARATLEAAGAANIGQVLVLSSATAYGAFADNPVPLRESDPLRGERNRFRYAADKALVERHVEAFARAHPACCVSVVRPVIVFGPNVDNYLSRIVYAFPLAPLLAGGHTPFQFIHDEDLAGVMVKILQQQARGAFNAAGEGTLTMREVVQLAGRRAISLPRALLEPVLAAMWRLHVSRLEAPASLLDFLEHPWVVSTDRVRDELGYAMQFSSRAALMEMVRSRR